jgi:hypothetical protein
MFSLNIYFSLKINNVAVQVNIFDEGMESSFGFILSTSLMVLEFEVRAPHLLGRCTIAWATPPALFALVIFETESHIFALADPSVYAFCIAVITSTHYHFQLYWLNWWGGGLTNILPRLILNRCPPNLHLPGNWGYRHESQHLAYVFNFFHQVFVVCVSLIAVSVGYSAIPYFLTMKKFIL